MELACYIYSCDRPALLAGCIAGLSPLGAVTVIDDCSTSQLPKCPRVLRPATRQGKLGFRNLWAMAMADAKTTTADGYLFAPDDFGQWNLPLLNKYLQGLNAHSPWCLNYVRDHRVTCWGYGPTGELLNTPGGTLRGMHWMDCAIIISKPAMARLNYTMPSIPQRWLRRGLSSGVGRYLSEAMVRLQIKIWQVPTSVCAHLGNDNSKMNPQARAATPIVLV